MFTSTPKDSTCLRVFVACLLSFMMLIAPIASVGAATINAVTRANLRTPGSNLKAEQPEERLSESVVAPLLPSISATKTDSFPDLNGDGKADPGETITYTTTIANAGPDPATGVQFTDTIDANTTLVPGSLKVSPLAFDDTYVAAQNTPLSVGAPGVLTNDTGTPAPTAIPIAGGATTGGGTITLNADGSFLYNPAPAFVGADTFTYSATNAQLPNNTATVTVNIDAPPSVTSTTPTNGATGVAATTDVTITFSEAVNVTGNWFQVVCGAQTKNPADTAVTGGPTTFTINPTTDLLAGNVCQVTVFAAQVSDQDGADPPDNMAANFVFSFSVPPAAVNDTYAPTIVGNVGINTDTSTDFSILTNDIPTTVTSINTSGTSAQGGTVVVAADGKFTYTPAAGFEGADSFTYTITNAAGTSNSATVSFTVAGMIWFINAAAGAGNGRLATPFNSVASFQALNNGAGNNPAAGDNIFIFENASNYTGPITLLSNQKLIGQDATATLAAISGVSVPADSFPLPAMNIGAPATTLNSSSAGVNAVNLNGAGTSNTVRGLTLTTGSSTSKGISGTSFGSLATADLIISGSGPAIDINTGSLSGSFNSISSSGGANGIRLNTIGGSSTLGTGTLSGATAEEFLVIGGTVTLTYDGTISTTAAGSRPVSITNKTTSGNVTFNGAVSASTSASGVNLDNNDGATITFRGGMALSTATNSAFNAINGGTIEVCDENPCVPTATGALVNTLTTTTGTALNVVSTTIGTNRLEFRSISSNGAANGINLSTTGTNGGLTVTGNSSGICGGSVTNTTTPATAATITAPVTADCTGGTIQSSTSDGIRLNNVVNVSLTRMQVINSAQNGIFGTQVNGFQLISSFISNNGNNVDEVGLKFTDVTNPGTVNGLVGTALGGSNPTRFINSTVRQSGEFNVEIINRTGTLTDLLVDGCQFTDTKLNSGPADADGFQAEMQNTAVATVRLTNSFFSNNFTQGAQLSAIDTANLTVTVTSSTFTNNNEGFVCNHSQSSDLTCTVGGDAGTQGNHFEGEPTDLDSGALIVASTGSTGTSSASQTTRIKNNFVSAPANMVNHSIIGFMSGTNTPISISISSNTVNHLSFGHAILVDTPDSNASPQFSVTANNNSVTNNAPGGHGVLVQARQNSTACVLIQNNAGAVAAGSSVARVRQAAVAGQNSILNLKQGISASVVATQVMIDNNPGVTTSVAGPTNGQLNVVANGVCSTPTAMYKPEVPNPRDSLARTNSTTKPAVSLRSTVDFSRKRSLPRTVASGVPSSDRASAATRQLAFSKPKRDTGSIVSYSATNAWLGQFHAPQQKKKPGTISVSRPIPPTPNAGETITPNIGTIPAGESVTITYQVTVNSPYLGGPNVSNQGTVSGSNFANVLTDDPSVGGSADPTLTPILLNPNVNVSDAQANEPPAGTASMLFVVSLSSPAPAAGTTIHYATTDQAPAMNHAVAGVDYTAIPDTVLSFAAGEQFKTISVDILADASAAESDETFLLLLSTPTNGVIVDGQAIGTIKQGNAAGTFLISELRTSGPAGLGDDFVELYNNTDAPLTIAASDASAGYGVYKMGADCNVTPALIGVIPNGTVIPARGHYLLVGSAYSLSNYGGAGAAAGNQTMSSDIESDRNVAVFSTSDLLAISSANRLDAVGFGPNTGGLCDLLREGTTLPVLSGSATEHSYHRDSCGKGGSAGGGVCPSFTPVDTNNNATNFLFADTVGTPIVGVPRRLGAPGPENLGAPIQRNSTIGNNLLDQSVGQGLAPNRVRDLTPGNVATSTFGTLSLRRRWTNNTGAPVTRLRFRVIDISSLPSPGAGTADVRALTSALVVISGVNDPATCLASTGSAVTPCTVNVQGTTLEQPPNQANGGALNSSFSAGTITLGTPLANGASINLQFLLGVQTTGAFKFYINVEALP